MDSRREFLKKAALLSAGTTLFDMLPPVIQKALAIDPEPGSTFYDAEHVVFLMQENRSFDHIFGTLKGVRGYNDPRAIQLPNGLPVWLQTDKKGDTYSPFRLNTLDSKVAWMGSLPHGWSDQQDARNNGRYDRWLEVKAARKKDYANMPLTLGFCNREDFPFYYSLADAFTVCDQHFCSSLTGTNPNRFYWMTGSLREDPADAASKAYLWNLTNERTPSLGWKTYPERLQEAGVSWRIYQNELSLGFGIENGEWLGNFGTNVMEFFEQYNVRLQSGRIDNLAVKRDAVLKLIETLQAGQGTDPAMAQRLAAARKLLAAVEADQQLYTTAKYDALSHGQKELMERAFTLNAGDPDYHSVTPLEYTEGAQHRSLNIPKGDILHQFRQDVGQGKLPAVSWLSAPGNFTDHPGEPWFGPWYVSEVMDILLKNPEVWKKTIVILTYDENDGYYDHVPPFVAPHPTKPETGKVSAGIDLRPEYVLNDDEQFNPSASPDHLRSGPIGLGYRVPMLIASPWTRGGYVCSEVFDHTSSLQFLEKFLAHKTGKRIPEPNITAWRRTVCGDLTSAFRPYKGEHVEKPAFIDKTAFIEHVNDAQFKDLPKGFRPLTAEELGLAKTGQRLSLLPQQEKGLRPACALPYELYVDGKFDKSKGVYGLSFRAASRAFGDKAAGCPFYVYAMTPYRTETLHCRNYAVKAGDRLQDEWALAGFEDGLYHLRVYGPNGFYREFKGGLDNPGLTVSLDYEWRKGQQLTGNLVLRLFNTGTTPLKIMVIDKSYGSTVRQLSLAVGETRPVVADLAGSHNWYDVAVTVEGRSGYEERFAGRVETGAEGISDPLIGS